MRNKWVRNIKHKNIYILSLNSDNIYVIANEG